MYVRILGGYFFVFVKLYVNLHFEILFAITIFNLKKSNIKTTDSYKKYKTKIKTKIKASENIEENTKNLTQNCKKINACYCIVT